jgi:hypothetical protein
MKIIAFLAVAWASFKIISASCSRVLGSLVDNSHILRNRIERRLRQSLRRVRDLRRKVFRRRVQANALASFTFIVGSPQRITCL